MSLLQANFHSILDHKSILRQLKLIIKLMELHDENPFKIRSYQTAVNAIDRGDISIENKTMEELQGINGIGKSIAEVISALAGTGTHPFLEDLFEKTPHGILEILEIKGLGPKKVKVLWNQLDVTSTHELKEACQSGEVAKIKGFGEKTQDSILEALSFMEANMGKWLYADLEENMEALSEKLSNLKSSEAVVAVGEFARKNEIIETVEWLIQTSDRVKTRKELIEINELEMDLKSSSPFTWRGRLNNPEVHTVIYITDKNSFVREKILRTGSKAHLLYPVKEGKSLVSLFEGDAKFESEIDFYQAAELPWIPEELREGYVEFDLAAENKLQELIRYEDLKGILHNHSTYSDGKHTLRQMAEHCKSLGYEYLGMADHSQTAMYAGGLDPDSVFKQQQEIDVLNKELAPFRVFKGIESDILTDGSLDYTEEVLASFDYIVASIHSGLSMDRKKATARIMKAVENPYTTILGHPTGRLLLRRDGYPVDHKAIIDACAINKVVIEINANPWRLDLDWRWINYAIEKGVILSINPDAHAMEGYADMRYGVLVGRKGGLTKDMTFNALNRDEIANYFESKRTNKK